MKRFVLRIDAPLALALLLGYLADVVPALLIPGDERVQLPLPLLLDVYSRADLVFRVGFLWAFLTGLVIDITGRHRSLGRRLFYAVATSFPVIGAIFLEAIFFERWRPHNILPIEVIWFLVLTTPVILGVVLAEAFHRIRSRFR